MRDVSRHVSTRLGRPHGVAPTLADARYSVGIRGRFWYDVPPGRAATKMAFLRQFHPIKRGDEVKGIEILSNANAILPFLRRY